MEPSPRLIALYAPVMQSGKSEIAKTLQLTRGFRLVKFADPFKAFVKQLLQEGGAPEPLAERMIEGDLKEREIPSLGASPRKMLQTVGSNWGRNTISPDLWVKLAKLKIEQCLSVGQSVVVDDLRFPNEYEMIVALGGSPVRVVREGAAPYRGHASEGLLEGFPMPTITNNGTLAQLRACAEQLPELLSE